MMSVDKIAVLGSGEMGHGIAEVAALSGFDVVMRDIKQEIVQNGYEKIEWSLKQLNEKGEVDQNPDEVLSRIETAVELKGAVSDVDAVIEAAPEKIDLKQDIFAEIDEYAPEHAILASNSSGIPPTTIAEATDNPERVIGMHFFNPVVMMDFIEIIRGEHTSEETVDITTDLADAFEKKYVVLNNDPPGFITSRVISRYNTEATWQYDEGEATIAEIDSACKFGVGFPMGPFELQDQTGLDIVDSEEQEEYDWLGNAGMAPSHKDLIEKGHVGKKSGKGWYDYEGGEGVTSSPDLSDSYNPLPIIAATVNEAARLVNWNVADPETIDRAMRLGTAYPKGPCRLGDEYGLDNVLESIKENDRWETSEHLRELVSEGKTGKEAGEGFYDYNQDDENTQSYESLQWEHDDETGVLKITLNRPMRRNALNATMLNELDAVAERVRSDPSEYRCIVFQGADGNFCAGGDISEFSGMEAHEAITRVDAFSKVEDIPVPTIAAIEGNCLGGGLELACACDFRIAQEGATIGATELDLGLIPGGGGTQRLPRLIGLAKAKELVMLGKRIDAEKAEELDLVMEAVGKEEFDERIDNLVGEVASGAPVAQKVAKYLLNDSLDAPIKSGLTMEQMSFSVLLETDDMMEGVESFFGDREPEFEGQ